MKNLAALVAALAALAFAGGAGAAPTAPTGEAGACNMVNIGAMHGMDTAVSAADPNGVSGMIIAIENTTSYGPPDFCPNPKRTPLRGGSRLSGHLRTPAPASGTTASSSNRQAGFGMCLDLAGASGRVVYVRPAASPSCGSMTRLRTPEGAHVEAVEAIGAERSRPAPRVA